jgi:hypothetical protein
MALKKFTVEVTRTDEYEIEIDTDVWNQERIDQYSKSFSEVEDIDDIVMEVARCISHQDKNAFIEGFGFIKQKWHRSEPGDLNTQYSSGFTKVKDDEYDQGLLVNIIAYADEYEVTSFIKK